jgi:hypothetical protein
LFGSDRNTCSNANESVLRITFLSQSGNFML